MTGREALKEELQRRGATKAQLNSKLIPWMLEIFSEGREEYIRLYELDREIDDAERKIKRLNADRLEAERELRQLRESAKKERQSLQEFREELEAREVGNTLSRDVDALCRFNLIIREDIVASKILSNQLKNNADHKKQNLNHRYITSFTILS